MDLLQVWKENKGRGTFNVTLNYALDVCKRLVSALKGQQVNIYALGYQYEALHNILPDNTFKSNLYVSFEDKAFCNVFFDVHFLNDPVIRAIEKSPSKYIMCFTKDDKAPIRLAKVAPFIKYSLSAAYNENNLLVPFNEEDKERYNHLQEVMNNVMGLFGDYEIITRCLTGYGNLSPREYRELHARDRGWSNDLNLSIPMFAEINKYYNPDNLYESATKYNSYIADRDRMISNNDNKITALAGIVEYLKNKRIVMIVKNGTVAEAVIGRLAHLLNGYQPAIHADMVSRCLPDPSTGTPVLVKSGADKGKPKLFGKKTLTAFYCDNFNAHRSDLLVITGSIDKDISLCDVDLLVIGSEKTLDYYGLKSRLGGRITFREQPNVVNVVMLDTKEHENVASKQKKYRIVAGDFIQIPDIPI